MSKRSLTLFAFAFFCLGLAGFSGSRNGSAIKKMVEAFKKDPRGPYQGIRWFCPDGTILPPKQRCPRPGGIQHALLKEAVKKLGQEHGIYLGQILAGTRFEDFLAAAHQSSRMKQYQMEKYLQAADDGWIVRRARYYRGAVQIEDEEAWGERFLT
ncbi:MAG: phosphoenolpyruvate synthase, partial [Calditrichaeota bacterium]